ncbi:MAG: carboxypeptidase regulatory-like domain-containing protein [Acidobacteria bacterium]|nr:carboxypeptidase regulatory-like domain-containing protein [Acidobacteriota bacterium]
MNFAIALIFFPLVAPAQEAQPKASVEGVVVNDVTGAPVRRAEVTLTLMTPNSGGAIMLGPSSPSVSAATDAEGKFRVENLEAGRYMVAVRKQGMMMGRTAADNRTLNLTAGQEMKGLRYKLQPQAIIAGRVLDDEGEPLQGVQVQVLGRQMLRGKAQWVPVSGGAPTNDRGEFRIPDVQPGRMMVSVAYMGGATPTVAAEPGKPAMGFTRTYYPGVAEQSQATVLKVTAGAELSGIDIQLRRVPVFTIRGKAVDGTGAPLAADFFVNVMSREGFGFMPVGRFSTRRQDGSFEVSGVPSGSYVVMLRTMNRNSEQSAAIENVDVNGSDVAGVTLRPQPPVVLQGQVVMEGVEPEKAKAALTSMRVMLAAAGMGLVVGGSMSGQVKEDGSFTVSAAPVGKYRLQVFGGIQQASYVAEIRAGSVDLLGREFELAGGGPGAIKVVFRTDGASVTGTVETLENGPTGRVMVTLMAKEAELREFSAGFRTTGVDQKGGFNLTVLRPGDYLLIAVAGTDPDFGFLRDAEWVAANLSKFKQVTLKAGQTERIQLKPIAAPAEPE